MALSFLICGKMNTLIMACGFKDASSVLNDLKKKSTKLSPGPPERYLLQTTRSNLDTDGKIRKWTFGQKYANMQNKTILMVGETGTGKTTLINTMVNYYLGVKFEDKVWFEITEEHQQDQTESKTSEITAYEIISEEKPFSLTIIDTPSYRDTRGIDHDEKITQNLHKRFLHETGVKDLDAVCLVLKASQNRISDRQRYIFKGTLSLFGKDIEDIIVLFITHSDGGAPTNVLEAVKKEKIPCCKDDENEPVHFLFNNRQSEKMMKKYSHISRASWEMGERSLEEFFEFLNFIQRTSATSILTNRIQFEACVQNLKKRIEYREEKEKELTQVQDLLKKYKEQIEMDENVLLKFEDLKRKYNNINAEGASSDINAFKDVAEELDKTLKLKEEMMNLESDLKRHLDENENEKKRSVKEAYEGIIKLSEITLKPDSAFTVQYLDFLIPRVEEAGEAEWAQKLKRMQKAAEKDSTKSVMRYLSSMWRKPWF